MKKFLLLVITLVLLIPTIIFADEAEKVKVYVFSAGGCPFCEREIEYLQGLESYNKTFEIVEKELFVDHINWEQGKDYELGVTIAKIFADAGFKDSENKPVQANATPLVVIGDVYAATGYSTELESVINKVYAAGDADVVGCVMEGRDDCELVHIEKNYTGIIVFGSIVGVMAIVIIAFAIVSGKQTEDEKENQE